MRSQKSINKKAAKARARRRDFVWRKNINANVPMETYVEKKQLFKPVLDENNRQMFHGDGRPRLTDAGTKDVIRKRMLPRLHWPDSLHEPDEDEDGRKVTMIHYPKVRRFKAKKQLVTK